MSVHSDQRGRGTVTHLGAILPETSWHTFIDSWLEVAEAMHVNSVDKGFWDEEIVHEFRRNTGEMIALMHSELSEALEGDRKPHPDKHVPAFDNLAVELADCVIRIMEFGHARDVPVAQALIAKAQANCARPYKHGGKKY